MEHPSYEELFNHLEGVSSPDAARRMEDHLQLCPQCAAELAGWRRSVKRLRHYEWPQGQPAIRSAWSAMALKWAAVAALVLGLGFGLGRASAPSPAALKESIVSEVRQQLRQTLRADLLQAIQQSQDRYQGTVLEALARLQEQHAADYLSLRRDLETAVSVADTDLKQKSRLLSELTATVLAKTVPAQ
jgi:hypothetical protein